MMKRSVGRPNKNRARIAEVQRHSDPAFLELWTGSDPDAENENSSIRTDGSVQLGYKSWEEIFKLMACKYSHLSDMPTTIKPPSVKGHRIPNLELERVEILFTDLWQNVWIYAVDSWDGKREFRIWVMFIFKNYRTDLWRKYYSLTHTKARESDSFGAPVESDDWHESPESVCDGDDPLIGDAPTEGLGKLLANIEDGEWLEGVLAQVKDPTTKTAIATIVRYYHTVNPDELNRKLKESTGMARPRMLTHLTNDEDLKKALGPGLTRVVRPPLKPIRTKHRTNKLPENPDLEIIAADPYLPVESGL